MTLGQYLAEAKVAAKARGSTPSRDPAPSQEAEPWRDMKPNALMLVAIRPELAVLGCTATVAFGLVYQSRWTDRAQRQCQFPRASAMSR